MWKNFCFKKTFAVCTALIWAGSASAQQNKGDSHLKKKELITETQVERHLKSFVASPHPFGSSAQAKYAATLEKNLTKFGWTTHLQKFESQSPSTDSKKTMSRKGYNVVALKPGKKDCGIIFGSHFDTKYFKEFNFVGANDGGSSTSLLLSLAEVIGKTSDEKKQTKCTLVFVFFDGEEAVLPNWEDGSFNFNIVDHLYGSRFFAQSVLAKNSAWQFDGTIINSAIILDMVGHKKQDLIITSGSDEKIADQILKSMTSVKIAKSEMKIEDDHVPFAEKGIPFVHIIDWQNINEWHTEQDNLKIISLDKLAKFGNGLLNYLGY